MYRQTGIISNDPCNIQIPKDARHIYLRKKDKVSRKTKNCKISRILRTTRSKFQLNCNFYTTVFKHKTVFVYNRKQNYSLQKLHGTELLLIMKKLNLTQEL